MKTVKIQVKWAAAHPGQDRRLPSVATYSRLQGWGSGQLGSGVAIDWVTGRSYSSARRPLNVQSGLRRVDGPTVAVRDIVDTEKVLREADGPVRKVETSVKNSRNKLTQQMKHKNHTQKQINDYQKTHKT